MNKKIDIKKISEILKRKETVSILLIILFLSAALFSMFISPQLYQWGTHEGDIALKDTYAPYDFTYSWGIDEDGTRKAMEKAVESVPFLLKRDRDAEEKTLNELRLFFDVMEEEGSKDVSLAERAVFVKENLGVDVSERNIKSLLAYTNIKDLRKKTLLIVENIFETGYINKEDSSYLKGKGIDKISVYDNSSVAGMERSYDELIGIYEIEETVASYSSEIFRSDRKTRQAVQNLITAYIVTNVVPDDEKTESVLNDVRDKVTSVLYSWHVKKNELIIEKGKRVDARHISQLSQLRSIFRPGTTPTFFIGVLLLFIILGIIAVIYISFTQKKSYLKQTKNIAIVLLNIFIALILADFIMRSPQPSYFIPLAGMGMIITLLVGFNVAFISVVLMSTFIAFLISGKIEVMLVLLVGSAVGMFAIKDVRRRVNILWAGLLAGVAKFLAISCIGLVNSMGMDFYVREGGWGIASGLLSGFLAMGLLPVFEYLFKVPTNISLLEMSDLNHPLLKQMALEAPGTYHHSIMVGNLAEAACDAIGANSLMARVGSYYHDIGKIPKAEYFGENEMGAISKHSNLTPSMSALIIGKHVKEGVEIAKKHKLDNSIINFITQHHGKSLIAYFYQKALEKTKDGRVLKEENFRYPGPKPQYKETAIVLMADSVEATSRSLTEPTPASIRNLVRKTINNKFIDGQLDECDLTLKDMHIIADSFVRVLMGVFHTRIKYPEDIKKASNGVLKDVTKNKQQKFKQKKKN